ncbi:MAG: 2-C-methyl-D-erythritol 2,4-cyclodiphosphate synthase [Bacteroidetes bacterium]|nr:2-C-methyl-D-erythritol 2,4-cyclodiphosphate synthase [Bacteroidota bacterium]
MTEIPYRTGLGYDVHRLAENESLVLGGVEIPAAYGTVAHSDGDVLIHAVCDALLGAAALGDIGEHFPDTDPQYKGISSLDLLQRCATLLHDTGWTVGNLDLTLMLESPKILSYKVQMRQNIATALGVPVDRIALKATTGEQIGFVGRGEGVEALAVILIHRED